MGETYSAVLTVCEHRLFAPIRDQWRAPSRLLQIQSASTQMGFKACPKGNIRLSPNVNRQRLQAMVSQPSNPVPPVGKLYFVMRECTVGNNIRILPMYWRRKLGRIRPQSPHAPFKASDQLPYRLRSTPLQPANVSERIEFDATAFRERDRADFA